MESKLCQIVLLPTDDKTTKVFRWKPAGKLGIYDSILRTEMFKQPQYIYFLSDERPKDGEWYCYKDELIAKLNIKTNPSAASAPYNYKIVASTDPSLGLSGIPEEWQRKYVASNGDIKEVRLQEWFDIDDDEDGPLTNSERESYRKLKLINNEVCIIGDEVRHGDMMILTDYPKVDQELEDAAEEKYKTVQDKYKWICKKEFIEGANWEKERSANDAVEFVKWSHENAEYSNEHCRWALHGTDNTYTSEELYKIYELWKNK